MTTTTTTTTTRVGGECRACNEYWNDRPGENWMHMLDECILFQKGK
jgi:hypothetical protein